MMLEYGWIAHAERYANWLLSVTIRQRRL